MGHAIGSMKKLDVTCTRGGTGTRIATTVFVLVFVWLWYGATAPSIDNATQQANISAALFGAAALSSLGVLVLLSWRLRDKKKGFSAYAAVLALVLYCVCLVLAFVHVSWGADVIQVLRRDDVYWLCMATALLVVCVVPDWGHEFTNADGQNKVQRARQVALVLVLCLLDLYTLYLLHEIVVVVDAEASASGDFNAKWHESVVIPPDRDALCDSIDTEKQTYTLLYQNQVARNETVSNEFHCLFELHESVRLNVLCAVVAWTIYRISAHENGIQLLATGMIFLAISTTVDDLRSYWVLGTEQAVFLTVALVLELMSRSVETEEDEEKSKIEKRKETSRIGTEIVKENADNPRIATGGEGDTEALLRDTDIGPPDFVLQF